MAAPGTVEHAACLAAFTSHAATQGLDLERVKVVEGEPRFLLARTTAIYNAWVAAWQASRAYAAQRLAEGDDPFSVADGEERDAETARRSM